MTGAKISFYLWPTARRAGHCNGTILLTASCHPFSKGKAMWLHFSAGCPQNPFASEVSLCIPTNYGFNPMDSKWCTFWILSRHSMNTPRATFLMLPGRCAQFQGICASLHLRLLCKQAMRVKLGKSSKNSPKACARWKLVSSNDHLEGSGATTNADCPVCGKGVSLLRWPLFGCSKG